MVVAVLFLIAQLVGVIAFVPAASPTFKFPLFVMDIVGVLPSRANGEDNGIVISAAVPEVIKPHPRDEY